MRAVVGLITGDSVEYGSPGKRVSVTFLPNGDLVIRRPWRLRVKVARQDWDTFSLYDDGMAGGRTDGMRR